MRNRSKKKLSATDYAIISCGENEIITSWDQRAEATFGWSARQACGQPLFYLLFPPAPETLPNLTLSDIVSTASGEEHEQFTITQIVQHKDGTKFEAHFLIFRIAKEKKYVVFVRDLRAQQHYLEKINISYHHQSILDGVHRIANEPISLQRQLERIFEYLLSTPSLGLQPRSAVFLAEQGRENFTPKAVKGFENERAIPCTSLPMGMCKCGQAAQFGPFMSSCSTKKKVDGCSFEKPHDHFCLPIKKDDEIFGVFCLYTQKGTVFSPAQEELFNSISQILARMIETKEMDLQLISMVHDLGSSINQLRDEKKFTESIIQGLTHGLVVTDLEGTVHTSNSAAEKIFLPFTQQLTGSNLIDVFGPETAGKLLDANFSPGQNQEREITLTNKGGEEKIISFSTVAREDSQGKEVGRILSINDISELKYVHKEMEKMNRLSTVAEIASAVAHEVRNPLAGIKIMAQSIEGKSISEEEQSECLTRIIRQVDRLNSLLSEFFSYARPAEPQVKLTSLPSIIGDTKPLIANRLQKNHIIFRENHEKDLPPILADPNQVQQVFLNLFLNAMDAIQQGGLIKIDSHLLEEPLLSEHRKKHPGLLPRKRYVAVTVTDNGVGMDAEMAEKIFEPFFTSKSTGTGLGLSIVYRTLKENKAAITVDSIPKRRTTFTLYFQTEE